MEWPPKKNGVPIPEDGRIKTLSTGGHGTIFVKDHIKEGLRITIYGNAPYPSLHLVVDSEDARIYIQENSADKGREVDWSSFRGTGNHALSTSREEKYWLSLDKSNGELRYGKFFVNATTMLRKIPGIDNQNGGTAL
jgi:hypothetical protein